MRGADLARDYAREVVGPLLDDAFPGMPIGLARLGSGSDVLGLDDTVSRDHDWGLRLTVLVPPDRVDDVDAVLEQRLPESWSGLPVRFPVTWDDRVHHRAEVTSVPGVGRARTGLDLTRWPTTAEWLSLTGQSVLELTAGPVYRDDDGELAALRARLEWYPRDVWLHALASGWAALGQELPFVGRTAQRGDELGGRAIVARLVEAAMRLGFLLERRWAPYSKWIGTEFRRLPHVGSLSAPLRRTLASASGAAREDALAQALDGLAWMQGSLGLPTFDPATEPFHLRGFRGVRDFPRVLREEMTDPAVRALPLVGTADQWTDSVDLATDPERRVGTTRALYAEGS